MPSMKWPKIQLEAKKVERELQFAGGGHQSTPPTFPRIPQNMALSCKPSCSYPHSTGSGSSSATHLLRHVFGWQQTCIALNTGHVALQWHAFDLFDWIVSVGAQSVDIFGQIHALYVHWRDSLLAKCSINGSCIGNCSLSNTEKFHYVEDADIG